VFLRDATDLTLSRGYTQLPVHTVLEQELGLTLLEDLGPREFLVIDNAQRP
jgi:hypothetical protein